MSGPQCCSNPPTLNPGSGEGHVEKLGGLDTYVTGSLDSKLGVLLVSDIFGIEHISIFLIVYLYPYFSLSSELFVFEQSVIRVACI